MLKPSLCNQSNVYILIKGIITTTVAGTDAVARQLHEINEGVMSTNCAPFTNSTREINNTRIDNIKYKDVVMPMHNLIVYCDNYSKISGK